MKVVILAGGLGTRLSEETVLKPKPMVEIGGKPILWHIMKLYASYGFRDFIIALGYKGDIIVDYFLNYHFHARDLTIDLSNGSVLVHQQNCEDWSVRLVDTGLSTQTGGRVKRIAQLIESEPFLLTYGDGLANIDLCQLVNFHQSKGKLATVTAVRPPARFGEIAFAGDLVHSFAEKPQIGEGWINGGFFVLDPAVAKYIDGDHSIWEREPMECLVEDCQLAAYRHSGFWQCMDTLRDVRMLEEMWVQGQAPWKTW